MPQEQVRDRTGSDRSPAPHSSLPVGLIAALSEGLPPAVVPVEEAGEGGGVGRGGKARGGRGLAG